MDSAIRVELDLRLHRRLAAPVEAAAYFAIAEAVTNAIRHGGGGHVRVALVNAGNALHISSRPGGPTTLDMQLPCAS